jgi:hypothetical protein
MRFHTLFQSAVVSAVQFPVLPVSGESARLTIGRYVPPTHRIAGLTR